MQRPADVPALHNSCPRIRLFTSDFSFPRPLQGIDVTGLPSSPAPAAPTPAPVAAAAAPVPASAPVAAEPAPVPYAQRKASPQAAPLGTLAKMPAAPAKPATPAAAAPAKPAAPAAAAPASQPVRSSSPAAAKWDHATRVMPAGSAAPVTPKMDPAAFSQEASKPAAPSPPPAGVNRWADFSLGHPNSSKRVRDVITSIRHVHSSCLPLPKPRRWPCTRLTRHAVPAAGH